MSDTVDRFLRVPEVAKRLGVCERIVWEMLADGVLTRRQLPGKRITFVAESELNKYMASICGGVQ